ncbi:rhomboid family intramembrane serine protease [Viridibacillus sp. YIM B01967]|uniref:Rhomboid family intramembrane serine protease n=1 Tax=Viridibacillus soli TaxID=2798301 RepID=A0ABS1H520_9BACL|nr:rhomboid family intramembrane serine protease [Viridibacillus soli]MBK3494512.1 rhomboid family intramembrane serine protease [Viridibacillus soli]
MFVRRENFSQYIKYYPVVSLLIALNILIHIMSLIPIIGDNVFGLGFGANYLIADGEYWRLVTPIFLHAGLLHLLFNMFSLYLFGPELEKIAGKMRFFTIYFIAGLMGNVLTYLIQPPSYVSVGASGAIFGIFGAFAALVYYTRNTMPQLKQTIMPIIVISLVMTFLQSNINVTAHVAGMVTGFIIGLIDFHPSRILNWRLKEKR